MSVFFCFLACIAQESFDDTWPQWRGPTRDGVVASSFTWPDKLQGEALQQIWRVDLGPSYSGPIVTADKVFITETLNKKTETVKALDRKTGKSLWVREWEGAMAVPFFANKFVTVKGRSPQRGRSFMCGKARTASAGSAKAW